MDDTKERLTLLHLFTEEPAWAEIVSEGLKVEKEKDKEYEEYRKQHGGQYGYLGWEWFDVSADRQTLNKMVTKKVLRIALSTRSSTHYRVRNPDLAQEVLQHLEAEQSSHQPEQEWPDDLFSCIVGHDNVKTVVSYALEAGKAVHILFQGVPASAKTLFLMELSRLPGSYYCLAQTMTGPGMAEVLFLNGPKFLLIDEIDRLAGDNIGVLNSLMATGIISESKYGKVRQAELSTKVFAAGVRTERLPKDLMSRFIKMRFPAYTEAEFRAVCRAILPREACNETVADHIAKQVWVMSAQNSDVRQAVSIARISGGDKARVDEVLKAMRQ